MNNGNWLLSHVGRTPLVKLRFPEAARGGRVWCKLEFMNPGGSLKDRMCLAIVESLESEGKIRPGDTLLEASCGNTAVSLAMIAAAKGYALTLVMPETTPGERVRFLETYGAEVILTPASVGMKGALAKATGLLGSKKRSFMINQFENPANPEIHRRTTAVEILQKLGKVPDVLVAGVGTGGTLTGVGEVMKEANPESRVVAVEPADSPILSGGNPGPHRIPGIGAGFVPTVLNTGIIDDVEVVTLDQAAQAVRLLATKEGILVGLSSGAVVCAAMRQAEKLTPEQSLVTILCDAGERYSSLGPQCGVTGRT